MVEDKAQHRTQRTVVIGAGDVGLAVVRAFRRRLVERWGDLPTVACLSIVGKSAAPDEDLPTVSLPIQCESATRTEAQEALRVAGPGVVRTLVEALIRISRISQRTCSQLKGQSTNWSQEVAFYVVAALDDPLGGGVFLDLAYLARYLASQRLNAPAGVTGLLFLPDTLNLGDPQPAMARTYAALRELDAWMGPHNGYTAQWNEGLRVQGWGPVFDQGCYLMGALNSEGLGLEGPPERIELAAEALLQLAVTPLAADCESSLTPLQSTGERPHNYAALGLAAWVYPCQALVEGLARRLAGEILTAWLSGDVDRSTSTPDGWKTADHNAAAFLTGCNRGVADVAETLLPAELLREAGLWHPLTPRLSPLRAKRFRQDLEDNAAERLESLAAQRSELDRCAKTIGVELSDSLAQAVVKCLDRAVPGRLVEAEAFLTEMEQHLAQLLTETQQAADAYWKDMETLDDKLEHVGQEMDRLAAFFPDPNWKAVLAILFRPQRLIRLVLAYRDLNRAGATFAALLAQQMAMAVEVLRRDLVAEVYQEALKGLAEQQARVSCLAGAICAAQQILACDYEAGRQGDNWSISPHHPWPAAGSLGFVLERSVLTRESVEALYALVRSVHPASSEQALADLLADMAKVQGPLSTWLRMEPSGEAIAKACWDYAHGRCQRLKHVTVDQLVLESLGSKQELMEALRSLVELASPFLGWDETRLRESERQVLHSCAVLGLGDGTASPLLKELGDIPWAHVVATSDNWRVIALRVMRGLPLAALAGLEEYAAAYYATDPKSHHADPDWADLPEPANVSYPMLKALSGEPEGGDR